MRGAKSTIALVVLLAATALRSRRSELATGLLAGFCATTAGVLLALLAASSEASVGGVLLVAVALAGLTSSFALLRGTPGSRFATLATILVITVTLASLIAPE